MARQAEDSAPGSPPDDGGNTMALVLGVVDFSHDREGFSRTRVVFVNG